MSSTRPCVPVLLDVAGGGVGARIKAGLSGLFYPNPEFKASYNNSHLATSSNSIHIELPPYLSHYSPTKMMSLIAHRAPSLILFGGLQAAMWTWVWSQQESSKLISGPLHSAIPKGYIGHARFQRHAHGTYAYA